MPTQLTHFSSGLTSIEGLYKNVSTTIVYHVHCAVSKYGDNVIHVKLTIYLFVKVIICHFVNVYT